MQYLSAKALPLISFVAIPCFSITIHLLAFSHLGTLSTVLLKLLVAKALFPLYIPVIDLYIPFNFFFIDFSYVFSIGYMIYPAIITTEKYFETRGFENSIIEYQYIKRILIVGVLCLIVLTIISQRNFRQYHDLLTFSTTRQAINLSLAVAFAQVGLLFIVSSTFLRIILQIGKKKFRFYYSKGCFRILSSQEDEIEKMGLLILGLNSYNKYVRTLLQH